MWSLVHYAFLIFDDFYYYFIQQLCVYCVNLSDAGASDTVHLKGYLTWTFYCIIYHTELSVTAWMSCATFIGFLAVRHRIDFKVAMMVFKSIHGLAPQYLADDCVLASTVRSRRHLRSADTMKLVVQRTKTIIGTRAFAVAAATVWNRLPADIRTSTCTVQTFGQKLKTFYASRRIWGFFILRGRNWLIIIIIIIIIIKITGSAGNAVKVTDSILNTYDDHF